MDRDPNEERAQVGEEGAVGPAGRRTTDAVSAAENITDSLELAENEERRLAEEAARPGGRSASFVANPLLLGLAPGAYLWKTLSSVRSVDLEQTLLVLPFTDALRLVKYLPGWLVHPDNVELAVRIATLLIRIHQAQLASIPDARPAMLELHKALRPAIQLLKDTMGFNLAAMRHVQRLVATRTSRFDEAAEEQQQGGLKRKLLEAIKPKQAAGRT